MFAPALCSFSRQSPDISVLKILKTNQELENAFPGADNARRILTKFRGANRGLGRTYQDVVATIFDNELVGRTPRIRWNKIDEDSYISVVAVGFPIENNTFMSDKGDKYASNLKQLLRRRNGFPSIRCSYGAAAGEPASVETRRAASFKAESVRGMSGGPLLSTRGKFQIRGVLCGPKECTTGSDRDSSRTYETEFTTFEHRHVWQILTAIPGSNKLEAPSKCLDKKGNDLIECKLVETQIFADQGLSRGVDGLDLVHLALDIGDEISVNPKMFFKFEKVSDDLESDRVFELNEGAKRAILIHLNEHLLDSIENGPLRAGQFGQASSSDGNSKNTVLTGQKLKHAVRGIKHKNRKRIGELFDKHGLFSASEKVTYVIDDWNYCDETIGDCSLGSDEIAFQLAEHAASGRSALDVAMIDLRNGADFTNSLVREAVAAAGRRYRLAFSDEILADLAIKDPTLIRMLVSSEFPLIPGGSSVQAQIAERLAEYAYVESLLVRVGDPDADEKRVSGIAAKAIGADDQAASLAFSALADIYAERGDAAAATRLQAAALSRARVALNNSSSLDEERKVTLQANVASIEASATLAHVNDDMLKKFSTEADSSYIAAKLNFARSGFRN